jgi:hypothetical protein
MLAISDNLARCFNASLLVRADDGMWLYNAFPKEKARIN